ncbi:MAG: hypothetical protein WD768_13195 [Phycisphaeraceae bacterium]
MSERAPVHRPMYCLGCEYRLDQLTERRCPECGRAFDPSDPHTFGETFVHLPTRGHLPPMIGVLGLVIGGAVGATFSVELMGLLAFCGLIIGFLVGYAFRSRGEQ